nr:MAG TPA: hypothetical protein [Caudoviricetes sp.]
MCPILSSARSRKFRRATIPSIVFLFKVVSLKVGEKRPAFTRTPSSRKAYPTLTAPGSMPNTNTLVLLLSKGKFVFEKMGDPSPLFVDRIEKFGGRLDNELLHTVGVLGLHHENDASPESKPMHIGVHLVNPLFLGSRHPHEGRRGLRLDVEKKSLTRGVVDDAVNVPSTVNFVVVYFTLDVLGLSKSSLNELSLKNSVVGLPNRGGHLEAYTTMLRLHFSQPVSWCLSLIEYSGGREALRRGVEVLVSESPIGTRVNCDRVVVWPIVRENRLFEVGNKKFTSTKRVE